MKERGIIMQGWGVRAILEDLKTNTRRVVTVPCGDGKRCAPWAPYYIEEDGCLLYQDEAGQYHPMEERCPYGVVGDRLWVRETWGSPDADHPRCKDGRKPQPGDRLVYRANPADDYQWGSGRPSQGSFCWRPSIFMPRWASRLLLEITEVRVERVQDISEEDARAEGVEPARAGQEEDGTPIKTYRTGFVSVWNSINEKRGFGWLANPWVFVVGFRSAAA